MRWEVESAFFLSALSERKTVATAVQIATEVSPKFDVASNLTLLDDAKVVVGIQEAGMSPKRSTRKEVENYSRTL